MKVIGLKVWVEAQVEIQDEDGAEYYEDLNPLELDFIPATSKDELAAAIQSMAPHMQTFVNDTWENVDKALRDLQEET